MSAVEAAVTVAPAQAPFLTVPEAADVARCHIETVREALRAGDLHGTQRVKGGTWKIRPECVNAWVEGDECPHRTSRSPVSLVSYRARGGVR